MTPSKCWWHGGKTYLAPKILALMPRHLHYVEPYFGGGAVLLARDPDDPRFFVGEVAHLRGVSEVVNDLNGRLINFWRVLQHPERFEQFRRRVEAIPLARDEWQKAHDHAYGRDAIPLARDEWQKAHDHAYGRDAVGDAVAFFVDARQSRSGAMQGFTPLTRRRIRRQMNGNVSEWLGAVEGLPAIHARLRRVVIEHMPALDLIRREDTAETLFYLDPPYLHETRTLTDAYAFEMTRQEHQDLLDVVRQCKGKVILSGYPSPLYDSALADWNRHAFDFANHAAGGARKDRETEVLWCNF